MKMKYSIIIPVYNGEEYICKSLDSCKPLLSVSEVIVVNDGSTDDTEVILKSYHGYKFKTITTENRGLSCARNLGIKEAKGEYVLFLDADDCWTLNIIQAIELVELNDSLDVLYFNAQNVIENDSNKIYIQDAYKIEENKIYSGEQVLDKCVFFNIPHEAWRGIYRRSFLLNNSISFIPGLIYEDNDYWFKIMKYAKKIMFSNIVAYNYLIRSNSTIRSTANYKNVDGVLTNIESILSENNISEGYLYAFSKKMVVLMKSCELRIPTSRVKDILKFCYNITERKQSIIIRVDELYDESKGDLLLAKYLFISNLVFFLGVYSAEMLKAVMESRERVIGYLKESFRGWSLDEEIKIGIYGSGRNSDFLLSTYQSMGGAIGTHCVYLDSNKKSLLWKHYNRDIINISDISMYGIDRIVIASNLYENQMYDYLKGLNLPIEIKRFYHGNRFSIEDIISHNYVELYRRLYDTRNEKRIILLHTPEYPNVGDHLIALAEKKFFEEYFSDYKIIEVTNEDYIFYKTRIKNVIKTSDLLVVTGGGFLGTLWIDGHYSEVLDLLKGYPNNPIIIMPQSIYFEDSKLGNNYIDYTKETFLRNKLLVFAREKYSFERLSDIVGQSNLTILCPDIALYYKKNDVYSDDRFAIGWFVRNDKESVVGEEILADMRMHLKNNNKKIIESSMQYHSIILRDAREAVVDEKLQEVSKYELIITDQLHCMISCFITKTPCIAFNNISKKVEGVFDWIKSCNFIFLAKNYSDYLDAYYQICKIREYKTNFNYDWNKMAETIKDVII